MAMLSDVDINRRLNSKDLIVNTILDPQLQIQPASIDVRLGATLLVHPQSLNKDFGRALDPRNPETLQGHLDPIKLTKAKGYTLKPSEFVLGSLFEYVYIPNDLVCRIEGRSSLGRLGVMVHITAGFVDPGFRGHLTLEIVNANCRPVKIYPLMRIAQLAFDQLETPAERPYGPERGSKYHSFDGPVGCRIGNDTDIQTDDQDG
jgi:dCTP deaminase